MAQLQAEVKRGEIVKIDENGITVIKRGLSGKGNFCDFEWAYFGRPNSLFPVSEEDGKTPGKWASILTFREKCGAIIAGENTVRKADFVVGLPDSGVSVAMGYANKLKIPYRQAIIRDHYDPSGNQRLFMRDDQKRRIQKRVLGKLTLVPDPKIWKDKIVIVGDDSIVRSNVSTNVTRAILAAGAKEVHWIVGFPPVTHPCHLGVSMRTKEELIASKYNSDSKRIARYIGAKSVNYISHRGFLKAKILTNRIVSPQDSRNIFLENGGCGGCLTGRYPVTKDGDVYKIFK